MKDKGINETTDQLQPVVSHTWPDTRKLQISTSRFGLSLEGKLGRRKYLSHSSMCSVNKHPHLSYHMIEETEPDFANRSS